ncbi:MAG: dihydropteroate synthase [Alphaproteobacteria bacterium]|nr:dihydropteroate synthase [Alphaproteobacteria bacterium]
MAEKLLFLTGHLAEARLSGTLADVGLAEDSYAVRNVGIKVAALMTEKILKNRLEAPLDATRVILPGRVRMDLKSVSDHFGVPFVLGPEEIIDLPQYLGRGGKPPDLSRYDINIFAEIVEAPEVPLGKLLERAHRHKAAGADVIDIGCRPDVPFPHLEVAVKAMKAEGFKVSVDSGDMDELRRGAQAGADFVLSLDEDNLDVVAGTTCVPVLVPKEHGDLNSLIRAIEKAKALGIAHLADPVLDPIHFGFMASLERYAELRRRCPDVEILMGTGNLTELTEADSQGLTAMLLGICSELNIRNVLIVQVSPHTIRTVEEHDAARRLMFRAREDNSLPKGYGGGLLSLHELRPFPQSPDEIAEAAAAIRDSNFRIEAAEDGVHIYNRVGHHVDVDPFELFGKLGVEDDGSHAFYLGYELAKAQIARSLGKRYTQDRPLEWGVAADKPDEDMVHHAPEGATLRAAREKAEREREKSSGTIEEKKIGGSASKPPHKGT